MSTVVSPVGSWQNHSWVVTEALRPMVINLNFERAGKIVFKSAGFAGYIGVITGMKPVSVGFITIVVVAWGLSVTLI